jgi:acyl-CoA synthetase (AMP-forming)/AMP-acid ligase II
MFDINLKKFGKKIALKEKEIFITYEELEREITEFEKTLPKQKQLIAFEIKPTIQHIVAYLAFLRQNYAILMVDYTLDSTLKQNIYNTYKPNFIYKSKLNPYNLEELNIYKHLSLLLPTSGSTGSSKYVRLTKSNLYENCNSIINYLPLTDKDITITNLPLYYSYGLSVLHTHLEIGATIVLSDFSLISKEFWEIFKKENITNLNGVPYHYEMLKRLGFLKNKYKSLKFLTQAGGKLNEKYVLLFADYAKKQGVDFFVMYGQTEATARISYLPSAKVLQKPTSIGIPIPNGELFIENNELIYKGKNVMLGYATSFEDLKKQDELKGVLKTGDLGYKDEDGYFYITGRAKRFIKVYGNRINLDEIEQFLKSQHKDIVVVGEDDKITIFSLHNDLDEIKELVLNKFNFYHKVLKIKQIKNFYIKPNGKIDYTKMLEIL